MTKAGLITDVVDVTRTQKQIDDTIKGLTEVIELINKANQAAKISGKGTAGSSNADLDKAAQLTKKLTELESQQAKEIALLNEKIRQKNQLNKDEVNSNAKVVGAYKALQTEVKKLGKEYADNVLEGKKSTEELKRMKATYDQARKSLVDLNQSMGKHNDDVGRYGKALEGLKGAWTGLVAIWSTAMIAGAGVIAYFKNAVAGAMADERAERRLTIALNGNVKAAERLLLFKERLMKTTMFSEEEIYSAINMGVELGRTEVQIKKLVETAMGLSRVTGQDLNSSIIALNATYEGSTGRLGKLASEVKGLTEEELKNGRAVDILNEKYVKFATEGISTTEGQVLLVKKAWEELSDTIGGKLIAYLAEVYVKYKAVLAIIGLSKTPSIEELDVMRAKTKEGLANIEAMREQAKLDQNRNKYLEDLSAKTDKVTSSTDKQTSALVRQNEEYERQMFLVEQLIERLGGGDKFKAKSIQVKTGGAPGGGKIQQTPNKIDPNAGEIPETKTDFGDDSLQKEAAIWNARISIAADAVSKIDAIVNQSYQNRFMQIEQEQDEDERAKQKEIDAARGNSVAIRAINDKYDAKEREREKEKRRLQREQAKYQKTAAITTAIINTAMAVTAQLTLPVVGWVMAALALAAGLAEIAVISAQPLPSYAKGRKGGKAEFANINEQGQEAVQTRTGEVYLPGGKVAYLPEGSSVIPHHELVDLSGKATTLSGVPEWQSSQSMSINELRGDIIDLHRGLAMVIRNKRENYINITERGMQKLTKDGSTWTEWVNDNVRL